MAPAPPIPAPLVPPALLMRLSEWIRVRFFPDAMDTSTGRWVVFLLVLLVAFVAGRFGVRLLFAKIEKLSVRVNNKLMVPALEPPAAVFVMLCGLVAAMSIVPFWESVPNLVWLGERGALTAVVLWGLACAGGAMIDHFADGVRARKLHVAAFIPLIKRTLAACFMVFSVLVVSESLGFEVKTFLAGLGIGGLAFALAAQDTIANLFGSLVVVMDQPFYVGEFIRVAGFEGTVEEIGLRSTRLRTAQRTQIVIPNKTVAAEVITNLTRMPQRRVDATIGVSYDTPIESLQAVLGDLRLLIRSDPGVHPGQVVVSLGELADSSLRIQLLYFTSDPDWEAHLAVRERLNIAILRTLAARNVTIAYPTSVMHLDGPIARQIVGQGN